MDRLVIGDLGFQGGDMFQITDDWNKGRIQLGLHHAFDLK
ncbi:hypothetical protein D1AOALGA4SA_13052 [Olavius algarvensis Delta 1 endosymbiont]|nr:hypothetical protein D1AOALGA4SA_13052 [Olavius algarvensis Delta 1 endosymbiont]